MNLSVKILSAVGIVFVVIQFIRPAHNTNGNKTETDISKVVSVPDSVHAILQKACYDCHSNNTVYPWYSNIQPAGWLMAKDILKGKDNINFSEFGSYPQRRRLSKLDEIANVITDDIMPLPSYKMMHKNARLNTNEKTILINWAQKSQDTISGRN